MKLSDKERELILALALPSEKYNGEAMATLLGVLADREVARVCEQDKVVQIPIKQNEIDWRRRRMELAQAILDESLTFDLDAIAAIVWPGHGDLIFGSHHENRSFFTLDTGTQSGIDPTQTPTLPNMRRLCWIAGCTEPATVSSGTCLIHAVPLE